MLLATDTVTVFVTRTGFKKAGNQGCSAVGGLSGNLLQHLCKRVVGWGKEKEDEGMAGFCQAHQSSGTYKIGNASLQVTVTALPKSV